VPAHHPLAQPVLGEHRFGKAQVGPAAHLRQGATLDAVDAGAIEAAFGPLDGPEPLFDGSQGPPEASPIAEARS
jgi:hypothetical protein